jgi:hypothetical protein
MFVVEEKEKRNAKSEAAPAICHLPQNLIQ